jgi:hypothetical protein
VRRLFLDYPGIHLEEPRIKLGRYWNWLPLNKGSDRYRYVSPAWHELYGDWRVSSSGIWRRVVRWVSTDVSEEHNASIFRVFDPERTTRRHIPEDDTLHNHRRENLKSYIWRVFIFDFRSSACSRIEIDRWIFLNIYIGGPWRKLVLVKTTTASF